MSYQAREAVAEGNGVPLEEMPRFRRHVHTETGEGVHKSWEDCDLTWCTWAGCTDEYREKAVQEVPKPVTETQLAKVLQAVKTQRSAYEGPLPSAVTDWDWLGYGPTASVVWEEGPFEWAHLFPFGGIEEEFGFKVPDVSEMIPSGVRVEPATSWAVSVYRD